MRPTRIVAGTLLGAVVAAVVAVAPAAAQSAGTTWVVDHDRVQCAHADFTSIQAAVDAAQAGDLIRVCPDHYSESVVIDKPLTLKGDPEAVEAIDCFQPTPSQLGDLDPAGQAILDPAGDGFTVALSLRADDIVVEGLVVEGASVGIDASDLFSGYRIHHNLIRLNRLFGIDLGSEGTAQSRVDHNCLRGNGWGVVSELDDDSLWKESDGPERDWWNARDLRNARIDDNHTTQNAVGIDTAGPGRRDSVTIERNRSRDIFIGIAFQNSTDSAIVDNDVRDAANASIAIGGANERLLIASNVIGNGGIGIRFQAGGFFDVFADASTDVTVVDNAVSGMTLTGINLTPGRAVRAGVVVPMGGVNDSQIVGNTTSDNGANGILLTAGNDRNEVRSNITERNRRNGIYAACLAQSGIPLGCATDNMFANNTMLGNGTLAGVDARDDSSPPPPLDNTWTGNTCVTDNQAGAICGTG